MMKSMDITIRNATCVRLPLLLPVGDHSCYILHLANFNAFQKCSHPNFNTRTQTSQELRMLSSVTINCQVTKIVINPGSQLSVL